MKQLRNGPFWFWLGAGLGLVVLYLLSVGPAVWLSERHLVPARTVTRLYRPLRVLDGTPLHRLLNAYVAWWIPASFEGDFPENSIQRPLF